VCRADLFDQFAQPLRLIRSAPQGTWSQSNGGADWLPSASVQPGLQETPAPFRLVPAESQPRHGAAGAPAHLLLAHTAQPA